MKLQGVTIYLFLNFLKNNHQDLYVSIYYQVVFPILGLLTQPNNREKSSPTHTVCSKLNLYKGIKGLYHISTNVASLLIIKQGHRPMFTARRQEARLE